MIMAAVEGAPPETIVRMDSIDGAMYTAREGYLAPAVGEVELVYVVFDVLYTEEEGSVIRRSLQVGVMEGWVHMLGPAGVYGTGVDA